MGLQSNRGSGLPLSNTEVGKISLNPHWNSTVISVGTFTCPWIVCRKNKGRGKKLGRVTFPMCLGRACSFDCTPTLCWMLTVLLLCHNDPSLPCLTSSFFSFYTPYCLSFLLTCLDLYVRVIDHCVWSFLPLFSSKNWIPLERSVPPVAVAPTQWWLMRVFVAASRAPCSSHPLFGGASLPLIYYPFLASHNACR